MDDQERQQIRDRYARAFEAFARTVEQVPTARWGDQSPCTEWTARDVVAHVVTTTGNIRSRVHFPDAGAPSAGDDPAGAVRAVQKAVLDDLDDPVRAGTVYDGGLGPTAFAHTIDRFMTFDLVVHRWDLARATGLDETIDPDEVGRLTEQVASMGSMMREYGAIGAEVAVPTDASAQDRLLGALGRRPGR